MNSEVAFLPLRHPQRCGQRSPPDLPIPHRGQDEAHPRRPGVGKRYSREPPLLLAEGLEEQGCDTHPGACAGRTPQWRGGDVVDRGSQGGAQGAVGLARGDELGHGLHPVIAGGMCAFSGIVLVSYVCFCSTVCITKYFEVHTCVLECQIP